MRYEYFVSYVSALGFSNCVIQRDKRIKTLDDITAIGKTIAEKNSYPTGAIVLNYRLVRFDFKKWRKTNETHTEN
jgi:hypothetical protein